MARRRRSAGAGIALAVLVLLAAATSPGTPAPAEATHIVGHPIVLRLRHVEPLCLAFDVGPPCAADAALGAFPSVHGSTAFDYGSPIGAVRTYAGPGWQLRSDLNDGITVGSFTGKADLFCDGTMDTLADEFSSPPFYSPYPLNAYSDPDGDATPNEPNDDLESWLLPHLPATNVYPPHSRARTSVDYAWIAGISSHELLSPYEVDLVTQRVPWSPLHPTTGERTLLSSLILNTGDHPSPALCLQALNTMTLPLFGYVDVNGDTAPEEEYIGNSPLAGADLNSDTVDDNTGFYLRWSVAVASDPAQWRRDQPYANSYRGRRVDIGLVVRCNYIDAAGSVSPPVGSNDDRDCLEDAATAQPGRPIDGDDSVADRDSDGLLDGVEQAWGSNPTQADSDVDSLSDAVELLLMTNPTLANTDGDARGDAIDRCPLVADSAQADADHDAWLNAYVVLHRGALLPSAASNETDPIATALQDQADITLGLLLLQPNALDPRVGGDLCDTDDDGDLLLDGSECTGTPPTCQKQQQGVALILADDDPLVDGGGPTGGAPDGNPANDLQDAGIRCVPADQTGDTVPELSPAAVFQGLTDSDGDTYPDGLECLLGSAPGNGPLMNTFPPGGSATITGATSTPECATAGGDNDGDGRTNDCQDADTDGLSDSAERHFRNVCIRVDPADRSAVTCNPALAQQDINSDAVPDIDNDADDDSLSGQADSDSDGDVRGDLNELLAPLLTLPAQRDTDGDSCADEIERSGTAAGDPRDAADFRDQTGDGTVVGSDIFRVVSLFGITLGGPTYTNRPDINKDGAIVGSDIFAVVAQFGLSCQ